ncbi:MAG: hypothetical protein M3P49_14175 [Actinomycetota bacterium]|nr:hypothetical protein [Actinomycetota bacterium]
MGSGLGGISLVQYLSEEELPAPMSLLGILASLAIIVILLWLAGSVLLYLYAVVLGGMEEGRAERSREP